jgi:hypothetical protein
MSADYPVAAAATLQRDWHLNLLPHYETKSRHLELATVCATLHLSARYTQHHLHRRRPMSAMLDSRPSGQDPDSQETREWLEALTAVIGTEGGAERAHFLLEQLIEEARLNGIDMPFSARTGYVNSIEPAQEARSPGNLELEGRLRAYMRWNAMAMVVKANRLHPPDGGDLGGHISSFASLAHMFAAGFNHPGYSELPNYRNFETEKYLPEIASVEVPELPNENCIQTVPPGWY